MNNTLKGRFIAVSVVSTVLLTALSLFLFSMGNANAQTVKVEICHCEGGSCETIEVAPSAVDAHIENHEDYVWACISSPGDPVCGNGELEDGEQCDDGNNENNDGCNQNCNIQDEEDDDREFCADEWQSINIEGETEVRYGTGGIYFYQTVSEDIDCSNAQFGDPVEGQFKHCDCMPVDEDEEDDMATIIATKIVCESEDDLPNRWLSGAGAPDITDDVINDFLEDHPDCSVQAGRQFERAANADSPNVVYGPAGEGWTTSDPTDLYGQVTIEIEPTDMNVALREVLQPGYISFGNIDPNVDSAEMYCHTDGLNHDNYDYVGAVEAGQTYYCVAFNAEAEVVWVCGDGEVNQRSEECDDGNLEDGDDCSANCTIEEREFCADEGETIDIDVLTQVRYGTGETFFYQTVTGDIDCDNEQFGDPIVGQLKHCDCMPISDIPPVTGANTANIIATKIVCDDESDLPNRGVSESGAPDIVAGSVEDFLADAEGCYLASGRQFEWASGDVDSPGNIYGYAGEGWTTSAVTNSNGMVTMTVPAPAPNIRIREVLLSGYIDFGYPDASAPSAEMYCHLDGFNHDNYDTVGDIVSGSTYYCIAFNVAAEDVCEINTSDTALYAIDALLNGLDGGNYVESFEVEAGDHIEISLDPGDTWSAGPSDDPFDRESNADGLAAYGFYLDPVSSQQFLYGSLVGRIGEGDYFYVWTYFSGSATDSGTLELLYWDSNSSDNEGEVLATVTIHTDELCEEEPDPRCGDGAVNQQGEQCDDGNNVNDDGCSATCTIETTPTSMGMIIATKIICEDESDLPNRWLSGTWAPDITPSVIEDFLDDNPDCELAAGRQFEWAADADSPNVVYWSAWGEWTTSTATDANGQTTIMVDSWTINVAVREVLLSWYQAFGNTNAGLPSAELYCNVDGLNHDNYDYVGTIVSGSTYYCVAFNTLATGTIITTGGNFSGGNNTGTVAIICGDGILSGNEACDDGNLIIGDGCSATCSIEICGDGFVDINGIDNNFGTTGDNEACDDGNTINGDGCSSTCEIELCEEIETFTYEVFALDDSYDSTPLVTTIELVSGDILTIEVDTTDTWVAGPEDRISNANGLDTGNVYGGIYGYFTNSDGSFPYGSLIGRIDTGAYFFIGTEYSEIVTQEGTLQLLFWDSGSSDNEGFVTVDISVESQFLCPQEPFCGDGIDNQPSEECDDGNTNNSDSCTNACQDNNGGGWGGGNSSSIPEGGELLDTGGDGDDDDDDDDDNRRSSGSRNNNDDDDDDEEDDDDDFSFAFDNDGGATSTPLVLGPAGNAFALELPAMLAETGAQLKGVQTNNNALFWILFLGLGSVGIVAYESLRKFNR